MPVLHTDMRRTETREYVFLRARTVPFWRVAAVAAIAVAVALALAILVSGLFLILLPAIVAGAIAARFMGRRAPPPQPRANPRGDPNRTAGARPPRADVIEAEYEVIEEHRSGEKPPKPDA